MGPIDLLWHLLDLFSMAMLLGVIASTGVWLRRSRGARDARLWRRLALAACGAAAAATLAGLALFGRDGRMATYLAMVLAVCLALALSGRPGKK
ncbi:MAG: hypothetical protein IT501_07435 [Rubrivivax sp.]|nr:hypothetical protein [Rubrivivax sp.]